MTARFIVGDTRSQLEELPAESVDLVLSSPPFMALRSYLPADDPAKAFEIGSERTPAEFIDVLLDVVEQCARVLTKYGSLVFELGDTYSANERGGGAWRLTEHAGRADFVGDPALARDRSEGWPMEKSLCMIPQSFAWALAYGRNPFNGRTTDPWRVRNVVAWCRPNPAVGALGDKFRPATTYLTVACKRHDRWFDAEAVRVPLKVPEAAVGGRQYYGSAEKGIDAQTKRDDEGQHRVIRSNPAGAPLLDWWELSTQPYAGAHYATWPERLCARPIVSMCPARVCDVCGEPSRRIVAPTERYAEQLGDSIRSANDNGAAVSQDRNKVQPAGMVAAEYETTGWTDCGHDQWRRGVVLDPFAGSGTTLAVAEGHGRDSIGIDLDRRNADLARERLGLLIDVRTS